MSTASNNYVNNLFMPLESYIETMKTVLYEIEEEGETSETNNQMLINGKNMLNDIMTKLDINQKNTKSTLEHIDSIMGSNTGGKKYKRRRRKTRKKRRN